MLSFARVLMILAGVFGLPALACSAFCSTVETAVRLDQPQEDLPPLMTALFWVAFVASIGSIAVGAKAHRLGKTRSGLLCLLFAAVYTSLLLQANFLGLVSAGMLLVAAIMTFVAPDEQFRGVVKAEVQDAAGGM